MKRRHFVKSLLTSTLGLSAVGLATTVLAKRGGPAKRGKPAPKQCCGCWQAYTSAQKAARPSQYAPEFAALRL